MLFRSYAAFANQGKQFNNTTIKSISSKFSEKVFTANESSRQVISPQGAFLISDILADNTARAPIFGNSLTVYDGKTRAVKKVAVKTGTTNDSRDAWAIGYTPQLAIGVWVGNNNNEAMSNGGSIMAGPIFTKAMGNILAGVDTGFTATSGVVQRNVCTSNHGLADSAVKGKTYQEWFLETALPTTKCGVVETPSPTPTPSPSVTPEPDDAAVTISLSANPVGTAKMGTNVTFTALLSSTSAQGIVVFKDGNINIGGSAVFNGTASIITPLLAPGNHTITATFTPTGGTPDDAVSASIAYQITLK